MPTKQEIEQKANQLLSKYSQTSAPVDVMALIEAEGIHLVIDEMDDDHSGFLLVENGVATIAINEDHHPNRQRFTAAHELGHYILHSEGRDRFFVDKAYYRGKTASEGTDSTEIEANRFAASLLMPEALVRERAQRVELTDVEIYRLSSLFQVSEQAMTLRLMNLNLIDSY